MERNPFEWNPLDEQQFETQETQPLEAYVAEEQEYIIEGTQEIERDSEYAQDEAADDEDLDNISEFEGTEEELELEDQEYTFGYGQLEHIGIGGTVVGGGEFSKLERRIQLESTSKEKLWIGTFKKELGKFGTDGLTFDKIDSYATKVELIPRYWLKNAAALATVFVIIKREKKGKKLEELLITMKKDTGIRREDLYRYYKLVKEYI